MTDKREKQLLHTFLSGPHCTGKTGKMTQLIPCQENTLNLGNLQKQGYRNEDVAILTCFACEIGTHLGD